MSYVNAAISLFDKANDFYKSYQNLADNYINNPVHKIELFLYENRYQVTNFLFWCYRLFLPPYFTTQKNKLFLQLKPNCVSQV